PTITTELLSVRRTRRPHRAGSPATRGGARACSSVSTTASGTLGGRSEAVKGGTICAAPPRGQARGTPRAGRGEARMVSSATGMADRPRSESSVTRAFLDTPEGHIHYQTAGSGPAVLLLHQTPRSSDEYRDVMPILARDFRVVAMDTVGYGDSYKPASPSPRAGSPPGPLAP